ncbi:anti-sigma regulatory factor [Desulfocicer niacini]
MLNDAAVEIRIRVEGDIVLVRKKIREAAGSAGFGGTDITRIVTAASELARNIFKYAGKGTVRCTRVENGSQQGLTIVFKDQGPGISDVTRALQSGYTTSNGLGMGLPGSRRLMDEMHIESAPGEGTIVVVSKWLK